MFCTCLNVWISVNIFLMPIIELEDILSNDTIDFVAKERKLSGNLAQILDRLPDRFVSFFF